ncbi:hypothetical protein D3877_28355 [Azospirillum cavernae]|uniref:Methionyl-tRNA formyltransferase n=2 Tax=Azospirillum cavernae TaxID=2320860 RepID=A0A418VL64_9PROT|nr:hypothetical protein D3877_28355 [Azospirillum cavernae]
MGMVRLCVFMNGDRGLAVCNALVAAGIDIDAVYLPAAMLKKEVVVAPLARLGLTVVGIENVNDPAFIDSVAARRPDIFAVAGFSTIFSTDLLAIPRLGTLNLHAGRLPQYRGGSPLNWQIINGESEAGLSVIRMDAGIDTGNVMAAGLIPIHIDDTIADVHAKANAAFPALVLDAIHRMTAGSPGERQDDRLAGYWHQRNDGDGRIVWERLNARAVHDLVRAITRPYNGAYCYLGDRMVRVFRTSLLNSFPVHGVPGRVVYLQGLGPLVICQDKAILLDDYSISENNAQKLPNGAHLR